MSYIPTRDRFDLDDATTERLIGLADALERAAVVAYHDYECHCGDPDRDERYHSYGAHQAYPMEILADLHSRGLLDLDAAGRAVLATADKEKASDA